MKNNKKKQYYIAGKISGLPRTEYYEKFELAELALLLKGYNFVNPVKLCEQAGIRNDDYPGLMLCCIQALKKCDGIYILNNYLDSCGAKIEREVALLLSQLNPDFEILYQPSEEEK
jgi:hypothetical protein